MSDFPVFDHVDNIQSMKDPISDQVTDIQSIREKLALLPDGYISYKNIKGKAYPYYQWKEDGKLKSRYLKKAEAEEMELKLKQRNALREMLKGRTDYSRYEKYYLKMMAQPVPIGVQDYEKLITEGLFYIDKTEFIRTWWDNHDEVTLITRPRRFGKTLNISMLNCFFSLKYAGRSDLFCHTKVWNYPHMKKLQGTFPVISVSFADAKQDNINDAIRSVGRTMYYVFEEFQDYLKECLASGQLTISEYSEFQEYAAALRKGTETFLIEDSLHYLSKVLYRCSGQKTLILLDEYDTPFQEAYVHGYWEEISLFFRNLFHASIKTNRYLQRALFTGITRIGKESMFSDLNHLRVVTCLSDEYADCFGFTEAEVFQALESQKLGAYRTIVQKWYDGFTIGEHTDIYNPWSIINYIKEKELKLYWANSGSNQLLSKLLQTGSPELKDKFRYLLSGGAIECRIEEDMIFSRLSSGNDAIWNLMLSSGYLKPVYNLQVTHEVQDSHEMSVAHEMPGVHIEQGSLVIPSEQNISPVPDKAAFYSQTRSLTITNLEVRVMLKQMIASWFEPCQDHYNGFVKALLRDDLYSMNEYINRVARSVFSYFDTGSGISSSVNSTAGSNLCSSYLSPSNPERFYHGFVLGLIVDLENRYVITSNRESGFGRYDCLLRPLRNRPEASHDPGIILEFKIQNKALENTLADTVSAALLQIENKHYDQILLDEKIPAEEIHKYGFAFCGKEILIGKG